MKEAEALRRSLEDLRESGEDEFVVALGEHLVSLAEAVHNQSEMIRGLMSVVDAAVTMSKINHERLFALEERARGISFEDMVDGKEPSPLGFTPEHYEELRKVNENLAKVTDEYREKL